MTITISPIYAGLLAILLVVLSLNVIARRRAARVSMGDGGDKALAKRIRVQANFVEYAPMGLILLALAEAQGAPGWVVHMLGAMLVGGRVLHAAGLSRTPQIPILRQIGMLLTFLMILGTGLGLIGHALV